MARAMNAIQRDGDTVGLETLNGEDKYNYLLRNLIWNFDPTTEAYYDGLINVSRRDSFINLGYLNDAINNMMSVYKSEDFYARWESTGTAGSPGLLAAGDRYSPFASGVINSREQTSNFNQYFTQTLSGLKCLKDCKILINLSVFIDGANYHNASFGLVATIKNTAGVIYAESTSDAYAPTGNVGGAFSQNPSAVIQCKKDDIIIAGYNYYNYNQTAHVRITLSRLER
jgi:hypothetical protein